MLKDVYSEIEVLFTDLLFLTILCFLCMMSVLVYHILLGFFVLYLGVYLYLLYLLGRLGGAVVKRLP